MGDETNLDDLVLVCDVCGAEGVYIALGEPWPEHCGQPWRLRNLTRRDGTPNPIIDRFGAR